MITRIYIDNYKCFTNFEYQPGPWQLLLGANGTGKTAVFDVLDRLRKSILVGKKTAENFPPRTVTAWDRRTEQTFELGLKGQGGEYDYRLVIEHDPAARRNRIKTEELRFDRRTVFQFDGKEAHLDRDDGSAGPVFPFDWSRSAIPTIPKREDNTLLSWFRKRLDRVLFFAPDPLRMASQSEKELARPDRWLHRLTSWIRHLQLEFPEASQRLNESLRQDVLDGFAGYKFSPQGEGAYVLKFAFGCPESDAGRKQRRAL